MAGAHYAGDFRVILAMYPFFINKSYKEPLTISRFALGRSARLSPHSWVSNQEHTTKSLYDSVISTGDDVTLAVKYNAVIVSESPGISVT